MKVAIIASTNGSVYAKLLDCPGFKDRIRYVLSDRECGAIDVARRANLPYKVLYADSGSDFSDKLVNEVPLEEITLFVSFYTRLFHREFIEATRGALINLHPSILPACPGMHGFEDTLRSGSTFIGATVHFVDEGIDTGPPIIQSARPLDPRKSETSLRHQVFLDQCRMLLQVIKWFEEGRVLLGDRRASIQNANYEQGPYSPSLDFQDAIEFGAPETK